jgi:hypothetical protein
MKKTEYRNQVRETLNSEVDDLSLNDKTALVRQCIVEAEEQAGYDKSNKGQPWSDDELRVLFTTAPTHENCVRLAKSFKRGVGGVKQIYQWAATPQNKINEVVPDSKFHKQIKRVAKEVGWIL